LFLSIPYNTYFKNFGNGGKLINETTIQTIDVEEVAQMILSRKKDFTIVDLRTYDKFEKYHIPASLNYSNSLSLSEMGSSGKKIIFYNQGNRINEKVAEKINSELSDFAFFLEGGLNSWYSKILFPNLNIPRGLSPKEKDNAERRSRYFGGTAKMKKTDIIKGEKYMREGC
jgi:rhodanese-related sulfurtransferase